MNTNDAHHSWQCYHRWHQKGPCKACVWWFHPVITRWYQLCDSLRDRRQITFDAIIIDLQICFQKMAADIMSKLFEADLDEVLREIFFNLDSVSIRSSRCGFLRNTIWHFTEAWDKGLKIPQLSQKRGVITFLLLLFHRFAFPQMRLPPMEWIHQATHPSKQVSLLIFVKNGQNYFFHQFPDLDGGGWRQNSTTNGSIGHRFPHTWRQ